MDFDKAIQKGTKLSTQCYKLAKRNEITEVSRQEMKSIGDLAKGLTTCVITGKLGSMRYVKCESENKELKNEIKELKNRLNNQENIEEQNKIRKEIEIKNKKIKSLEKLISKKGGNPSNFELGESEKPLEPEDQFELLKQRLGLI